MSCGAFHDAMFGVGSGTKCPWQTPRASSLIMESFFDGFEIGKAEEFVEIFDLIHLVFRKGYPSTLGDDQQPFMGTTIGEGHTVFLSVIRQSTPSLWTPWVLLACVCDGLSASPGHGRSGVHSSLVTTHHS